MFSRFLLYALYHITHIIDQSSLHLTPPPPMMTMPLDQGQANAWRGDQYDRHGSRAVSLMI